MIKPNEEQSNVANNNNAPIKSIKDMFKNLASNNKILSDQVDKLQSKVETQNLDLFNRVKKDLSRNKIHI